MQLKQARACGTPVIGPLLKKKANQFAVWLGHENFLCLDCWLVQFTKRREVTYRVINGEANSVPESIIDDFLYNKLPNLFQGYDPKVILKVDETGHFFELLPDRTYTSNGHICLDG